MKIKSLLLISLILISSFFLLATPVLGENTPTWEVGVPGLAKAGESMATEGGFTNLVKIIIQWAFRLAGILAFAMVIYAGFEYAVFSGAPAKQKDAQERIVNAIIGLLLLFGFWLILNTVNPDILKTKEPTLKQLQPFVKDLPIPSSMANLKDFNNIQLSSRLQQGNAYANSLIIQNLEELIRQSNLKQVDLKWIITETCITNDVPCATLVQHSDPCHKEGTCVDLVLENPTTVNQEQFINIANGVGLDIYNEYNKNCWESITTGYHFHVAIHSSSCKATNCWFCATGSGGGGGSGAG